MSEFNYNLKPNKRSIARRMPIYGIGINDADYIVQILIDGKKTLDPFYSKWHDMLKRCYSSKSLLENPSYIGCSVASEWHSFMAFKYWMEEQKWEGKELDKDILIPGNKVYSPDTCIFVSRVVNALLCDSLASRGEYPQGVSLCNRAKKYRVRIKLYGKEKFLGRYYTVETAEAAYIKAKSAYIKEVALKLTDARVRDALIKRADNMINSINSETQEVCHG